MNLNRILSGYVGKNIFLFNSMIVSVFFTASLGIAGGTFGPQSSSANVDWGFDFVETFEGLQDWKGTVVNSNVLYYQQPDEMPKHLDGSISNWEYYAIWGINKEYNKNWIQDHGVDSGGRRNVWRGAGKSLLLNLSRKKEGPNGFGLYFGDGTPESGYDDLYFFHMVKITKSQWPSVIDPKTKMGSYTEGSGYTWYSSWKFIVFNIGMLDRMKPSWGRNLGKVFPYSPYQHVPSLKVPFPRDPQRVVIDTESARRSISANWDNDTKSPTDFLPDWWGIEYHFRNENRITHIDVWIYDKGGNSWQVFNDHQYTYDLTPLSHKWNDFHFGVNNSDTYEWGETMDPEFYVDDIIINGSRIGPKYFTIINAPKAVEANILDIKP